MSLGTYHRRVASTGDGGNAATAQHSGLTTSAIEPRTYGTSWNSVRWNKSMESSGNSSSGGGGGGAGGHWSRFMSTSEPSSKNHNSNPSYSTSPAGRFGSQSATRTNIEIRNSGPSVRERSARFGGSMLSVMHDTTSNRTSRLPWLADTSANRRSTTYNNFTRNSRENTFSANNRWKPSSSSVTRSFQPSMRNSTFSSATPSTSLHERSFLSNTPQTVNSNYGSPALRAERPWRQRMADAARLRNVHGDEIGGAIHSKLTTVRARRSNTSSQRNGNNNSGDELQNSLHALKSYMDDRTTGLLRRNNRPSSRDSSLVPGDKSSADNFVIPTYRYTPIRGFYQSRLNSTRPREYVSRSYSPIRPRPNVYSATLSKYNSLSTDLLLRPLRSSRQPSTNSLYDNVKMHVLGQPPLNSPIRESSRERESSRRLLSSKERTLRHRSHLRGQETTDSDSSSGTEQRAESRERRLRKRFRKKSNGKEKSVDKLPPKSSEKVVVKIDDKINEKSEMQNNNAGQNQQLRSSVALENSEKLSSTVASKLNRRQPELRIIPTQYDEVENAKATEDKSLESTEKVDAEGMGNLLNKVLNGVESKEKAKNKPKKGLFSFIKRKKTAEKCDDKSVSKANSSECKKESKKGNVEKKKGDKCVECRGTTVENNMLSIDVQLVDQEGLSLDQFAPRFVSPTSPSSLSSSHKNTNFLCVNSRKKVTGTSADDISETSEHHYGAVAHFNPSGRVKSSTSKSKSRSPAPVPGTWSGPEHHEMNISQNKHLQRHEASSNAKVLAIITKKCLFCTIPPMTVCATMPKRQKPVETALNCALQAPDASSEKVLLRKKYHRLVQMNKKLREPTEVSTKFEASFISRARSVQDKCDIVKVKRCDGKKCSLTMKEPSVRLIAVRESMSKKINEQNSCRAQVTVLTSPVPGVNFYRCRKRMRATRPKRHSLPAENIPQQASSITNPQNSMPTTAFLENSQNQKEVSDEMGCASHHLPPWRGADVDEAQSKQDDLIVLPDRSVLEEYVKRKREKLERMHSEPLEMSVSESCDSPSLSMASELMQACAVRVLEPTRQVPFITAPSRSRLGSVEVEAVSTPTPKASVAGPCKTVDLLSCGENLLSASYHGLKSSPVNRSERSTSLTKPTFEFDVPMSPFEQRLQNQALQLRKISTFSDGDVPAVQDTPTVNITMQLPVHEQNRRSSVEGTSIANSFTSAAAAAVAQPRYERYAAHIPINRADGSGRHSAASVDSSHSGVLDTASRQLDQMIDQARYRHHQHRSKFKEAIDYLDQIFEDLKKEGDQTIEVTPRSRVAPIAPKRKETLNSGTELQNAAVPLVKLRQHNGAKRALVNDAGLEEMGPRQVPLAASNRHSLHITKPRLAEKYCQQEKAAGSFEQTSEDVDVSETIVLPPPDRKLKGERLDFTRRWLAGDIKSWAMAQPKPDLILGGLEEEPDFDERSLGSCSAEVAAINSTVRKKKKTRDMPDVIQNVTSTAKYVRRPGATHQMDSSMRKGNGGHYIQQSGPIKPQPVKAQAMFPLPSSSSGNLKNFNSFPQPFRDDNAWANNYDDVNGGQYPLQRTSSHNRVPDKKFSGGDTVSWRSTSQDANNTLSSARSTEIHPSTRKMGAFTPVQPPNIVTMRSSVASLPESSVIRPQPLRDADPVLAIDALVAELELNTDQTTMANKRRSFPTGIEFSVLRAGDSEQPISSRQLLQSNAQQPAWTKSEHSTRFKPQKPQKPKPTFDEMANMLQSVANDVMSSNELSKGRRHEQAPMKNIMRSPFETINQEKLNPSKVEALHSMFENKQHAPRWRRNISSNNNIQQAQNAKNDDNYCEINELGIFRNELSPNYFKPSGNQSSSPVRSTFQQQLHVPLTHAPSQHEPTPAFPVSQPPSYPPGSANSSQTGGYYSSGSSLGATSSYASHNNQSSLPRSPARRGSVIGKQSISSQAASLDDEDDGFYDNIQIDEKRFSRGSELDSLSIGSHRLPPAVASKPAGNRLGRFLRKINASKPPASAASLVSLNKVASEIISSEPIPLMKSNSLSHDPWKRHIAQNVESTPQRGAVDKRGGLGQRLKSSIFGSKKRLN